MGVDGGPGRLKCLGLVSWRGYAITALTFAPSSVHAGAAREQDEARKSGGLFLSPLHKRVSKHKKGYTYKTRDKCEKNEFETGSCSETALRVRLYSRACQGCATADPLNRGYIS